MTKNFRPKFSDYIFNYKNSLTTNQMGFDTIEINLVFSFFQCDKDSIKSFCNLMSEIRAAWRRIPIKKLKRDYQTLVLANTTQRTCFPSKPSVLTADEEQHPSLKNTPLPQNPSPGGSIQHHRNPPGEK